MRCTDASRRAHTLQKLTWSKAVIGKIGNQGCLVVHDVEATRHRMSLRRQLPDEDIWTERRGHELPFSNSIERHV